MTVNRSAPAGPVVPRIVYRDVAQAIEWLSGAFGFKERLRTAPQPDGTIHHAQVAIGAGSVILTGQREHVARPGISLFIPVDNVDAHFERAKAFGAHVFGVPTTYPFGERQYTAEDLQGYV